MYYITFVSSVKKKKKKMKNRKSIGVRLWSKCRKMAWSHETKLRKSINFVRKVATRTLWNVKTFHSFLSWSFWKVDIFEWNSNEMIFILFCVIIVFTLPKHFATKFTCENFEKSNLECTNKQLSHTLLHTITKFKVKNTHANSLKQIKTRAQRNFARLIRSKIYEKLLIISVANAQHTTQLV